METDEGINKFVQDRAWVITRRAPARLAATTIRTPVLDPSFRVRGVKGLHVVDASVFRILASSSLCRFT